MDPENRHWTDEDILRHVYGAESVREAHLQGCGVCRQRLQAVAANLGRVRAQPEPEDTAFFAAQRRRVYERVDRSRAKRLSWRVGSALVAAAAMLIILLNVENRREPPVGTPAGSDAQLYREISAMVSQEEPSFGQPMRELFKETSQ